jgi:hypothetical protein
MRWGWTVPTKTTPREPEPRRTRVCRHCRTTFVPTSELQAFCRPSCRIAHLGGPSGQGRLPLGDPEELFREPFK